MKGRGSVRGRVPEWDQDVPHCKLCGVGCLPGYRCVRCQEVFCDICVKSNRHFCVYWERLKKRSIQAFLWDKVYLDKWR